MNKNKNNETTIALMAQDIRYIKEDVTEIKLKLEKDYVTREEFEPIKKVVYGLIGLILVAVVSAIIGLVIISK